MNDERDDRETNDAPGTTRRGLLSAVTGGFALATGGLLLPDWLVDETEADNHPVRRIQHRKERKRQKQRHHRHHRRNHRRNQNHKQPAAAPRGVQMIAHVNAGKGVVRTGLLARVGNSWEPVGAGKDLRQGDVATFQTAHASAILELAGFITEYVNIFNIRVEQFGQDLPKVTMAYGCWATPACDTIVFAQGLAVGEASARMQADGYSFRVTRLSDTAAYQVFDVVISPPVS